MKHFSDRLLIGTYTSKQRGGIYLAEFSKQGIIKIIQHVNNADNPSYLSVAPKKNIVLAVNEGAGEAAKLSSYKLENDKLTLINQVSSGGDHPCYVDIHSSGKWAAVANYTGGNMTVFGIKNDGSVTNFIHEIHHEGSGPFIKRQAKPHAHSAVFHNDELYYTDLGLDKIFHYRFPANDQMPLQNSEEKIISVAPGGGPRHIAFHPTTDDLYVIEEMTGAVSFYKKSNGYTFTQRVICSNDPESEDKGSADIHVSPDGKYLYASNRAKANSFALFRIEKDGKLTLKTHIPTRGEQPRNFVIHHSNEFLLVANQRTDNIVVFKRNDREGTLSKISEISVPNPVCLKFV
jgi:6-phosphogluconolactonase